MESARSPVGFFAVAFLARFAIFRSNVCLEIRGRIVIKFLFYFLYFKLMKSAELTNRKNKITNSIFHLLHVANMCSFLFIKGIEI